ncbi:MAG: hypothetical protein Harvfovirus7_36, partial [Harvfovirus sp.]
IIKADDLEYLRDSLTSLVLVDNTSIDPLILPKLKLVSLNLDFNESVPYEILMQCKTVKRLYISHERIPQCKYLTALTALEKLSITSGYSSDVMELNFAVIASITSLTELVIINGAKVINIKNVSMLMSLKKLKIDRIGEMLIKPEDLELDSLTNLTDLAIRTDKMKGECFIHLTQLTTLRMNGKVFNSLNLKYLEKLKYLYLENLCDVQEINLIELSSLVFLQINCFFKRILSGVNTNLQHLYIDNGYCSLEVIDDRLISKLIGLRYLTIRLKHMISIECLLNLTNLVSVELTYNKEFNQEALELLIKQGVIFKYYDWE